MYYEYFFYERLTQDIFSEKRNRPIITKVQKNDVPAYGLTETRRVFNDSKHPSGSPQPRKDLFSVCHHDS